MGWELEDLTCILNPIYSILTNYHEVHYYQSYGGIICGNNLSLLNMMLLVCFLLIAQLVMFDIFQLSTC